MTGDEVAYAGGIAVNYNATFESRFNNYYLYNGYYYWLISPVDKYSSAAGVSAFDIRSDGSISGFTVSSNYALRPSIALIPSITIISGDGTINNPYVINES